jgi:hypothetical protein
VLICRRGHAAEAESQPSETEKLDLLHMHLYLLKVEALHKVGALHKAGARGGGWSGHATVTSADDNACAAFGSTLTAAFADIASSCLPPSCIPRPGQEANSLRTKLVTSVIAHVNVALPTCRHDTSLPVLLTASSAGVCHVPC